MKHKLKGEKYMGVCRCECIPIKIIKLKFPITVTIYINRNRKNKGTWRSSWSVNPTRMNAVVKDPFPGAIPP